MLIEGLPALAAALEASGRSVTWDADFPGCNRFSATDPFGNRFELIEHEHG